MGMIRKTASISTLGLIKFRSKKERLRRAEAAHRSASDDLAAEQVARAAAEHRVAEAERRTRHAELEALHEAKVSRRRARKLNDRKDRGAKTGRGRRARRKAAKRARHAETTVRDSVSGLVSAAQPVLEAGARGARRHGRAARKRAVEAAAQVAPLVEDAATKAREKATDLAERARDSIDA